MPDCGESVLVVFRCWGVRPLVISKQAACVFPRHSVDPLIVRSYGPAQAHAVLLHHVADRLHPAVGEIEGWVKPVLEPLLPLGTPVLQCGTEVTEPAKRKEVDPNGHDDIVSRNQG